MALKVYVNFDGTVARPGIMRVFAEEFGGKRCGEVRMQYREGRSSARQCLREVLSLMGEVSRSQVSDFFRLWPVDEYVADLMSLSASGAIDLTIVSDGIDLAVMESLSRFGANEHQCCSNRIQWEASGSEGRGRLRPEFPHANIECDRCACCIRNVMLTRSGDDDRIVFVGSGPADECPARYADLVFARGPLQTYCQRENITYRPYDSLKDVADRLRTLAAQRRVRKRRRAELRRREAFMIE
jgi:2-hydroxy-3-keto-5-methylthiopentenyl-1-phosphate phosphatase